MMPPPTASRAHERHAARLGWVAAVLLAVGCNVFGVDAGSGGPPPTLERGAEPAAVLPLRIRDPETESIDLANLYANEAFWPYQIQLTGDWKPEGWEGEFGWGLGVVLRIDPENRLRVDFGGFGKHWIPAEETDVIARANAIREGEASKLRPNLVLALDNRLFDVSGEKLRPSTHDLRSVESFVLVFTDPKSETFPEMASALETVSEVEGTLMVLISPIDHGDFGLSWLCREAGWKGVFLRDRFGPAYTEGYAEGVLGETQPGGGRVQVLTPEGRLLWASPWSGRSAASSLVGILAETSENPASGSSNISKP